MRGTIQGKNRVREQRQHGSVRGVPGTPATPPRSAPDPPSCREGYQEQSDRPIGICRPLEGE